MRQVIYIKEEGLATEKPIEFTHFAETIRDNGWKKTDYQASNYEKVVYLGKCDRDGDMFAAYCRLGYIAIFKGHLNSGKY